MPGLLGGLLYRIHRVIANSYKRAANLAALLTIYEG